MKEILVKIKVRKIVCWQVNIVFVYSAMLSVVSFTLKTKKVIVSKNYFCTKYILKII